MKYHGTKEQLIARAEELAKIAYVPLVEIPTPLLAPFREYLTEVAKPEYKELTMRQASPVEYWRGFLASDDFGDLISDCEFIEPLTLIVGEDAPAAAVKLATARWPNYATDPGHGRALSVFVQGYKAAPAASSPIVESGPAQAEKLAAIKQRLAAAPGLPWALDEQVQQVWSPSTQRYIGTEGTMKDPEIAFIVNASEDISFLLSLLEVVALPSAAAASIEGGGPAQGLRLGEDFDRIMTQLDLTIAGQPEEDGHDLFEYKAWAERLTKAWEPVIQAYTAAWSAAPLLVDAVAAPSLWVSVDERLPEEGRKVWVAVKERHHYRFGGAIVMRAYTAGKPGMVGPSFADNDAENIAVESVSHWMYATVPAAPATA